MNETISELIEAIRLAGTLALAIDQIDDYQSQKLNNADKIMQLSTEIKDSKIFFNENLEILKEIIKDIKFFKI